MSGAEDAEAVSERLQDLFEEAGKCKNNGEYSTAIEYYTQILEADPNYKEAAYNLANTYRLTHQMDLAVTYWQKALKIDKDFVGAHINLGIALRGMGKLDDAIYHYLQVVELEDSCTEAYVNLGVAHAARGARGDSRKAADYYSKAISLDPGCLIAHFNLALHHKQEGHLDDAINSLKQVLLLNPEDTAVHCQMGSLLLDVQAQKAKHLWGSVRTFTTGDIDQAQGLLEQEALESPDIKKEREEITIRLEQAMDCFESAIKYNPEMTEAHVGKGLVLLEQKLLDEARAHFEAVAARWPQCLVAQKKLAILYRKLNQPEKALQAWEAVHELDPTNKEALNAMGHAYKKVFRGHTFLLIQKDSGVLVLRKF